VKRIAQILVMLLFSTFASAATCIPFDQAQKHMGETQCVTGKIVRVEAGSGAVHYSIFAMTTGCAVFRS
jgi:isoleucyl-tRNA synthetase